MNWKELDEQCEVVTATEMYEIHNERSAPVLKYQRPAASNGDYAAYYLLNKMNIHGAFLYKVTGNVNS